MNESHTGDLFESQPATPETTRRGAPNAAPQPETLALAEDANLSDLDLALAHWARRHGADRLVARAFALASWAVAQGEGS